MTTKAGGLLGIFCILSMMLVGVFVMSGTAQAAFVDFEADIPYDFYTDYVGERSSELAYSGSWSAKLGLNDPMDYARVAVEASGPLGSASGTFWANVTQGSDPMLAPYMMFVVDANFNNIYDYSGPDGGDAIVIAFISGADPVTPGEWFQSGLDSTTTVHVVGNRSGLASGTFSSSGTQGTLAALSALEFGSGWYWGDLNLLQARVAVGQWPKSGEFTAYVDDICVPGGNAVPVPAAVWLLGSGLVGLAGLRRKLK